MVNRLHCKGLLIAMFLVPGLAASVAAQPKNHIGEALANIMVSAGCTMTDKDAFEAMQSEGLGASDYQAQALALHRGGYLTSNDGGKTLTLTKWGVCK